MIDSRRETSTGKAEAGSGNNLLRHLMPILAVPLRPHLERVPIARAAKLAQGGLPVEYVYFIESGLVAVRAGSMDIATIGFEGVTSVFLANGMDRSPYDCNVHIAGVAQRMPASAFMELVAKYDVFRQIMLLYAQALSVQLTEHTICNAKQPLQARVARWLLMCHDRIGGTDIDITHACLSDALSVRRAGVTDALHVLEGIQAIRSKRSLIVVRDRDRLREAARGAYGVAEAEYDRLLGRTLIPPSVKTPLGDLETSSAKLDGHNGLGRPTHAAGTADQMARSTHG